MYFVEVILPLSLAKPLLTGFQRLSITIKKRDAYCGSLKVIYTALALDLHQNSPLYEAKEINQILTINQL
jgi:hypothetical protein